MADTLLQEAIAEARQVRDAAIANAKIALEEAFTPRLAKALSEKLRNEMEDATKNDAHGTEDGGETDHQAIKEQDALSSSTIGTGDNKKASLDSSNIDNPEQEVEAMGDGDSGADPKIGGSDPAPEGSDAHPETLHEEFPGDEEEDEMGLGDEPEVDLDPSLGAGPEMGMEPEMEPDMGDEFGDEEEDLDLESIIRELEAYVMGNRHEDVPVAVAEDQTDAAADVAADVSVDTKGDKAPEGEAATLKLSESEDEEEEKEDDDDDEVDLDEILREMDVEAQGKDPHYYAKVAENLQTENANLKRNLKEHRNVVKFLKNRINEINMVNAKLLFANKLFKNFDLNNSQKVRVIETFDRATTLREVKIVYTTLAEAYAGKTAQPSKKVKTITEGIASKASGSTKPKSKQVINEEVDTVKERLMHLAGIKKEILS